ncbi:MAG: TrkA family potassium uptake protein [Oscillospiraceae bacterium]|nr:TrkA family potassium uptake protein [Oscillospiraceae bacterium]
MKSFLIIGMGSLGHHLCRAFSGMKCELMIVDLNADAMEDILPYVVSARVGDCTKEEVLKNLDVPSFDACFVCVGSNFEVSLQITNLLKELRAKKVFSKADRDVQEKFLLHNGADVVIFPEKTIALNIAIQEISDSIFDCLTLTGDYVICEILPMKEWVGKTVAELKMRENYRLSLLAVKKGVNVEPMPDIGYRFSEDEHVIVLGHIRDIEKCAF